MRLEVQRGTPRTYGVGTCRYVPEGNNPLIMEQAGEIVLIATAIRVFGRDAAFVLRRLSAGIRAAVTEMTRPEHEGEGGR
ncbi:hypothetical protein BBN63_34275 [Streptomyces niveus]|uniref:Uncharacterized protein n=1 Tax=Streptomyces niveus TaxID=193462 RepID=A0A1U9R1V2_STRNV|nr:hypothetical protein BBN63_34275 [Streptomyces niveus]